MGLWYSARHDGPRDFGTGTGTDRRRAPGRVTGAIDDRLAAVVPALQRDIDRSEPGRPWRILDLNRGIVAMRAHDPALMRAMFDELVRNLPEDALAFFAKGMAQMDALGHPAPVREVMENYRRRFVVKTLH